MQAYEFTVCANADPNQGKNGSDDTTCLKRHVTGNRYMYSFPLSKLSKVTVYDKAFFTVDLKDLTVFFSFYSKATLIRQRRLFQSE